MVEGWGSDLGLTCPVRVMTLEAICHRDHHSLLSHVVSGCHNQDRKMCEVWNFNKVGLN